MKEHFEIVVFTAAQENYARKVVHALDKEENLIDHVLSRENCIHMESLHIIVKDLSILMSGRELKDMLIIDNRVVSYALNMDNGLPIRDFHGDKSDRDLKALAKYLIDNFS